MKIWIGIDGGGTRATAAALDETGAVVVRVEGGAALVDPLHPLAGVDDLGLLVRRAIEQAGGSGAAEGLCCALAGAGRASTREKITTEISRLGVAKRVFVIGDAEAAMHDAFGDKAGVLLIAGTGSAAWVRTAGGRTARAGGWGTLLGDEGSGYAIGLSALRAVVRAADGRMKPTSLAARVLEATGSKAVEDLIAWTAAAEKASVAALTPVVIKEASGGDAAAAAIVAKASADLASQVAAVVNETGPWSAPIDVAFTGGLISPGRGMRDPVWRALQTLPTPFVLREAPVDAARGAAFLARLGV